jgi:hypothetical protein
MHQHAEIHFSADLTPFIELRRAKRAGFDVICVYDALKPLESRY